MVSLDHMQYFEVVRSMNNFIAATATLFAEGGDMMVQ